MDSEVAKNIQKILSKQGIKFKLNTKVLGGERKADEVTVNIESAKDGKQESVGCPFFGVLTAF